MPLYDMALLLGPFLGGLVGDDLDKLGESYSIPRESNYLNNECLAQTIQVISHVAIQSPHYIGIRTLKGIGLEREPDGTLEMPDACMRGSATS